MYVSHAVRSIRDDPIEGEEVTLLLEADDASMDDLAAAVQDVGGTVEEELEFETLKVTVGHEQVEAVCAIEGLASIETANTLELDPGGAGEDVDLDDR